MDDRGAMRDNLRGTLPSQGSVDTAEGGPTSKKQKENAERRKLRVEFRELIDRTNADRVNLTNLTSADLKKSILEQEKLFSRVQRPQEAALDAKAFITTSTSAAHKARQMKVDQNAFDTNEFIIRLKSKLGQKRTASAAIGEDEDDEIDEIGGGFGNWEHIGWMGARFSKRVCLTDFLLGPLSVEQKTRSIVRRAKLNIRAEDKAAPINVNSDRVPKDANETSIMTLQVEDLLAEATGENGGEGVNFFEFIINPHSFSQTVENMFHLSFVIGKGKAALDIIPETGILGVSGSEPADDTDAQQGVSKLQMVMEMDIDTWKEAIEVFDIREPRWIPHRQEK
ncbi:Uncharacterized conserved protein [Phaffia rhodozyma]|uniref:Non-structural maintenance of chromosomes element 4 n=1 Tax=Phaffia rhodozyma TaxID=264483 RepID=A0A0F7SHC0_PHARH|nr:Uncharacterized conserved protein [Phaffia rhodozyma]